VEALGPAATVAVTVAPGASLTARSSLSVMTALSGLPPSTASVASNDVHAVSESSVGPAAAMTSPAKTVPAVSALPPARLGGHTVFAGV
jgi:hypothetical protein